MTRLQFMRIRAFGTLWRSFGQQKDVREQQGDWTVLPLLEEESSVVFKRNFGVLKKREHGV